jgi:2-polyprenyl-3-methyl-5-hydroxy-6-metoxy-1,4-benzoquinol methylase
MRDTQRRVSFIEQMDFSPESVLDIGTGWGQFLDEISPYVSTVAGTELASEKRGAIRNRTEHSIHRNTETALNEYGTGSFDLITLFHVLEHFPEPAEQLAKIRTLLADDGVLLIEVPNHQDYLRRTCEPYFEFYYQPAHVYYYTPESLHHLLSMSDLSGEIHYTQRYGQKNAQHWFQYGVPQIDSPDMIDHSQPETDNRAYKRALAERGLSDTILMSAVKQ